MEGSCVVAAELGVMDLDRGFIIKVNRISSQHSDTDKYVRGHGFVDISGSVDISLT